KTGDGDFTECLGIALAILLSVFITLVMEGSSLKAFAALNKIYDSLAVKVIRDGKTVVIPQNEVVAGDLILLEAGDKIIADGRIIESNSLSIDESALTGESKPVKKRADVLLSVSVPLAERVNCAYSGTFVTAGSGKMLVTAVGDFTEIGRIAREISVSKTDDSPLQKKLNKLGKTVTAVGIITAAFVFIISAVRLYNGGNFTFSSVQELFISAIILIVAAVPEGLPTIVAISLALNMIKLSKENALVKKMTATETAGAVSVICSDKTGTLTKNKMAVDSVCVGETCTKSTGEIKGILLENFALNTTATFSGGKAQGSGTEKAIIEFFRSKSKTDLNSFRAKYGLIAREDFSSEKKYMTTTVAISGTERTYIKGAPEKVLPLCSLSLSQRAGIFSAMEKKERDAKRVLSFAHRDGGEEKYVFDGFISISDPVRADAERAIAECKRAGIGVKMLTGDNKITAYAIARELGIADSESMVVNASDVEDLDEQSLIRALSKITVIARSTPTVKLKVVNALKRAGEVVAVTGDGINDAPAIRHADIGIAMGGTGSEITKEAADCVLTDDSFATVVKAVSFGRNVYKNLQRFISFQLSVNFSALLFITLTCVLGLPSPFNTLQLLWINVIMDGPPALTLGLEPPSDKLMKNSPVKKDEGILNAKMLLRIAFNGALVAGVLIAQYVFNFMGATAGEKNGTIFTLFILFQLFNAFNCRELGTESIFKRLNKNKLMVLTFACVFLLHIFMVTVFSGLFGIGAMRISMLLKCVLVSSSIVIFSETYKLVYRIFFRKREPIFTVNKKYFGVNKKRVQRID
ncbi:MAG: calcium-translocating P-type ATPase, PMCA-type, partial [Clostridia bacterium]|nr:calcium-translocating P-type ATPase, PMCA-type [Clostridia bacterium]